MLQEINLLHQVNFLKLIRYKFDGFINNYSIVLLLAIANKYKINVKYLVKNKLNDPKMPTHH